MQINPATGTSSFRKLRVIADWRSQAKCNNVPTGKVCRGAGTNSEHPCQANIRVYFCVLTARGSEAPARTPMGYSASQPRARARRSQRNRVCAAHLRYARLALHGERRCRYDRPTIGASLREPVTQHGPGIVGDSGERSDAHPVYEIESNLTFPMALPLINDVGARHGSSQTRRRGVSQCSRD